MVTKWSQIHIGNNVYLNGIPLGNVRGIKQPRPIAQSVIKFLLKRGKKKLSIMKI